MGDQYPPPVINHSSHDHSLVLLNCPTTHSTSSCAGCEQHLYGLIYTCDPCKYSLHLSCSQAPRSIRHPADTNHSLWLLQYPAYPQGYFYCNACGGQGRSFSYHCAPCGVDLHLFCAFMASSLHTHAHNHPLQLFFRPPSTLHYCDICRGVISSKGNYRCNMCDFDAHVACAHRALTMSNINGDPRRRVDGGSNDEAPRGQGLHHGFSRIEPYIELVSPFAKLLGMFFGSDNSGR